MSRARVRVTGFGPTRPWSRPGSRARIRLALAATAGTTVRAKFELQDLDQVVVHLERTFRIPRGRSERCVDVRLPSPPRHGYGLNIDLRWPGGHAAAASAVEALDGWWESPRHAAITDFTSPDGIAAAMSALRDWHVTVVQDYDWMYRHYRYEPEEGDAFVDPLGRRVSHTAVRAGVAAGRRAGIATLAYGSVYGAEHEYVLGHPDERVFDGAGTPLSLGETFFINDLRPGSSWRQRLLGEYSRAITRFRFDGIHMDTYGPPHRAIGADGGLVDFTSIYPGLIEEAARVVARARPGARVLFNCVEGFPLDDVAKAPAAALYLELWPPDVEYRDVVRWIDRAREIGGGRAVVIAAYISALRSAESEPDGRGGAIEAAVLLTSIIAAAGGYHHVLAEGDRLLVEGYYPEARSLRAAEARELRAAWAFTARYLHLLSDADLRTAATDEIELLDADRRPIALSSRPEAGTVWLRRAEAPDGTSIVHLIDLLGQRDDRWDAFRAPSPRRTGWLLRWRGAHAVLAMSPWTAGGKAIGIRPARDGTWSLPAFRRWLSAIHRPETRAVE